MDDLGNGGCNKMKTNALESRIDDQSFAAFVDQIQIRPHEFISDPNDIPVKEGQNSLPLSLKNETSKALESGGRTDHLLEPVDDMDPLAIFLKEAETKPAESMKECLTSQQDSPFMTSFLVELAQCIKNTLASIYQVTLLTVEKVEDVEIRKHSHTQVKEHIKKIDSVLNSLLNFININTPIPKTNTLYTILEEILEANAQPLQEKKIKIIKQCEKDLPETYIHNEQVRFILHSILQYAISSTPPNESIGFLMKSLDLREETGIDKSPTESKRSYVEMTIGFHGKSWNSLETLSGLPGNQKEEATDLILKLVREILQKNHGRMMMETNGKKPNTLITLRFPIERRNVVYYAPITL